MSTFAQPALLAGMQETYSKILTEAEAVLYAGLVGDNSAHVLTTGADRQDNRMQVHFMLMAGIIGGLLNTRLPGEGSQCVNIQLEFLAPIHTGDRIDTVIELLEYNQGKHLATFKTDCFNQLKNQVITGQAVMLVPDQAKMD